MVDHLLHTLFNFCPHDRMIILPPKPTLTNIGGAEESALERTAP